MAGRLRRYRGWLVGAAVLAVVGAVLFGLAWNERAPPDPLWSDEEAEARFARIVPGMGRDAVQDIMYSPEQREFLNRNSPPAPPEALNGRYTHWMGGGWVVEITWAKGKVVSTFLHPPRPQTAVEKAARTLSHLLGR